MSQDEKKADTGMADSSKGKKLTPESDQQTSAADSEKEPLESSGSDTTSSKANTRKAGKTGLWLFVFILILLAFGGGGYAAYQYLNEQMLGREAAIAANLQSLENNFVDLQQSSEGLTRRQNEFQRALTAAVSGTERQMTALAERLAASESAGPADWTLAEVEYLLRIANQRLITSRDSRTALDMLQAADSILEELAYPELAVVRRQLAADITALQIANQVDVEGIYFTLEALMTEVPKLNGYAPEQLEYSVADTAEDASRLRVLWNKVLSLLSRFVQIDTAAGDPEYLATDEQQLIRGLAIQLQLRQAQLALLSGQQELYSAALNGASVSIDEYYGHSEAGIKLALRFRELSAHQVRTEAADISVSIRTLSDVVNQLSKTDSPAIREQ